MTRDDTDERLARLKAYRERQAAGRAPFVVEEPWAERAQRWGAWLAEERAAQEELLRRRYAEEAERAWEEIAERRKEREKKRREYWDRQPIRPWWAHVGTCWHAGRNPPRPTSDEAWASESTGGALFFNAVSGKPAGRSRNWERWQREP